MNNLLTDRRQHVVVVDDNPVNLELAEAVLKDGYKVTKLISGEQLLRMLDRVRPDLILLDIKMPGMDGFQTLKEIRKNYMLSDIPVIFLSAQMDTSGEQECFRLGAQDYIGKPFNEGVMKSRIHAQLELFQYRNSLKSVIKEKTGQIEELQHVITISWAEMVESRDGTTGSHVRNTSRYYKILLDLLADSPEYAGEFPPELRTDYVRASYLHDIGKISISDEVLKKPGPLTPDEFECMKTHTIIGAKTIQKIIDNSHMHGFMEYAREMAWEHHERWDGGGYPRGLAGEEIPLYVRVLSIADVYDALTSVRPYKEAFTHEQAMEIMEQDRGKFFCPGVFDIFVQNQDIIRNKMESKSD